MRRRRTAFGMAIAGASALAAAAVLKAASAARRRRMQLARGEIRELTGLWTTVAGCRVFARTSARCEADAPFRLPIVFVHGLGVCGTYFMPAAERLATQFAVYVPDLPGHGRSDTPAEPPDVPRMADLLVEWMDAVGIGRAMLIGNSMGCQIAADAAVRYPRRVDRMVLIGPTVDPAARSIAQLFCRLVACGLHERLSILWVLAKDYSRMGLRLVPEFRFMRRDRIERKLPLVTAPVMIVRGENDWVAPQRWVNEAARLAQARHVAVIPKWGHAIHYSAAPQFVAAVLPFLREPAARAALG